LKFEEDPIRGCWDILLWSWWIYLSHTHLSDCSRSLASAEIEILLRMGYQPRFVRSGKIGWARLTETLGDVVDGNVIKAKDTEKWSESVELRKCVYGGGSWGKFWNWSITKLGINE
jgi:hypothetical protein